MTTINQTPKTETSMMNFVTEKSVILGVEVAAGALLIGHGAGWLYLTAAAVIAIYSAWWKN